jgi:protein-disulfide isomerase
MPDLAQPINALDHSRGPIDAPVSLLEYGDFECPNCKQAAPVVKLLLERFASRIRFVYRHFPLEAVHPHALQAAIAAEAAGVQDRFWPMHDQLFAGQPHFEPQDLRGYAMALGLDLDRYDADMLDKRHLESVRDHLRSGEASGVRATPTFFIDGRICDVSYGLHALAEGVETALRTYERHAGAAGADSPIAKASVRRRSP